MDPDDLDLSNAARRRVVNPVPAEGADGLFSQSWFPVALSREVAVGAVVGREFLGGRIAIYRGEDGAARVISAYCPHMGSDLTLGEVIGTRLRCAFHGWEFNRNGICVRTGSGDAPPPDACVYRFPCEEQYGIVWAFNGNAPLWPLKRLSRSDDKLVFDTAVLEPIPCDPWVVAAHVPDLAHFPIVHKARLVGEPKVAWHEWGVDVSVVLPEPGGADYLFEMGVRGTSTYWQESPFNGSWLGVIVGFALPRPGMHITYAALRVETSETAPGGLPGARERLQTAMQYFTQDVKIDKRILDAVHARPGQLTKADRSLARFLDMLRDYPRAHPSADFIR